MKLFVGTSGFSYKEWKGSFYPETLGNADMLSYYGERLNAVEINNTFYRMPRQSVLDGWAAQVPAAFRFSIKASRKITHFKRLKPEAADETAYLLDTVATLGDRLGTLLFQLPPNMKPDLDRLRGFLELIPDGTPIAFEFRHDYDEADLVRWAGHVRAQSWERAFVFFKHEDEGAGPRLARRFRDIFEEDA